MNNLETNIYRASSICEGSFVHLTEYSKIYAFTNENINDYIKYFDFNNKNLLTVGSSGDQILNAFFYGTKDITLFDINPYAQYYIYLKIAAILSLDYIEFQSFFFKRGIQNYYNKDMFSKELFNKIKPNLRMFDYESLLFFDELLSHYESSQIRDNLFDDDEYRNSVIKSFNAYLKDEDSYNKLKSIIKNINFLYINGDIFKDDIPGQYDNILLSNLCTTTNIQNIKTLLEKLDLNNTKANGNILIGYLWNINYYEENFLDDWKDFYKLPLTKEVLKNFISEHHQINGAIDCLKKENTKSDLVLIYRKKQHKTNL